MTEPQPVTMTANLIPSLFACHRPIERYQELCATSAEDACPSAVDSFIMSQVPEGYDSAPVVLDLAADATGGASVALWASHPGVRQVVAPGLTVGGWRDAFPAIVAEMGISPERFHLTDNAPGLATRTRPVRSILVNLAVPSSDTADTRALLADVLRRYPGSLVILSTLGPTGSSPPMEAALAVCAADPGYQLTLFREVSPFLFASRLGLIHPTRSVERDAVIDRLRRAFGGNFQFLTLLRTVTEQATRLAVAEQAGGHAKSIRSVPRVMDKEAYVALGKRIRLVADEVIPTGATVLVISKGDDQLLELGDRRGLHFPQTLDGTYAGHHPADGANVIGHLRALRAKGADYLLVPAPYYWWLEHYAEFRGYVEKTGQVVTCRPDTCVIYNLRPRRQSSRLSTKSRAKRNDG